MARVMYDTEKNKAVALYETESFRISFHHNKQDRSMDNIKFVKLGTEYSDPIISWIYRYEDEQVINDMLKMYEYEEEEGN